MNNTDAEKKKIEIFVLRKIFCKAIGYHVRGIWS